MMMTREKFIAVVAPIAVKLRREGSPIFPSVRIAQTILETGCTLHAWNNLVGYKVGSGQLTPFWRGRSVSTKTWEVYDGIRVDGVQANWRAYDSIADCFRDQDLLFGRNRYDLVRNAKTPREQAAMLHTCGYATDPAYADKVQSLIYIYDLKRYDEEAARPVLEKEVAKNIISSYLSPRWFECEKERAKAEEEGRQDDAAEWLKLRNWQKYLADELRKASGIPVE